MVVKATKIAVSVEIGKGAVLVKVTGENASLGEPPRAILFDAGKHALIPRG